jgi:hypothetical protein
MGSCLPLKRGKEGRGSPVVHSDPNTPDDDEVLFSRYAHEHVEDNQQVLISIHAAINGECDNSDWARNVGPILVKLLFSGVGAMFARTGFKSTYCIQASNAASSSNT